MRILIVIVSIIGFAAVVGAIYIGTKSFDGVVVEHPYERGLDWDREQHLKAELGWSLNLRNETISTGLNSLAFRVIDKEGNPLRDISVTLRVCRPSTARYDMVRREVPVRNGWFTADVEIPLPGMWDLQVTVAKGERMVELRERIFAWQQ